MIRESLFSGAIAGALLVIINIVIYLIDPLLLANWWLGLAFFPVLFVMIVVIGLRVRAKEGGYMTFGNAFKVTFIAGMIAGLISTLWAVLLHNVVDPGLGEVLMEETLERVTAMMEGFGAPTEQIEEEFEKAREGMVDQYTPQTLMTGWVYSAIGWALGALLASLIVKKNPPVDVFDA